MGLSAFDTGGISIFGKYQKGVTLDTCVAKGTWTASGTWTIPAVTLGGAINANGQNIGIAGDITVGSAKGFMGSASGGYIFYGLSTSVSPLLVMSAVDRTGYEGQIGFRTPNAAGTGAIERLTLTGKVATAVATWTSVTHTGLVLSGALLYGANQVVGARVIDARCDDVVDATYGAEEAGVLDALRDAMITHGLIAAA